MSEIENKVVIITGASSGLGEATARRLAQGGAKLMLAARREDRLKELVEEIGKAGGVAKYQVTDVTDQKQMKALAEATHKAYGKVDVLVNNAGLMPLSPLAGTQGRRMGSDGGCQHQGRAIRCSSSAADHERAKVGPYHQSFFGSRP